MVSEKVGEATAREGLGWSSCMADSMGSSWELAVGLTGWSGLWREKRRGLGGCSASSSSTAAAAATAAVERNWMSMIERGPMEAVSSSSEFPSWVLLFLWAFFVGEAAGVGMAVTWAKPL